MSALFTPACGLGPVLRQAAETALVHLTKPVHTINIVAIGGLLIPVRAAFATFSPNST